MVFSRQMLPIAICVGVPLLALGVWYWMRHQYGDEVFTLDWPTQELNREDDYRLIKLRIGHKESGRRSE
jgi:hypothetical protein